MAPMKMQSALSAGIERELDRPIYAKREPAAMIWYRLAFTLLLMLVAGCSACSGPSDVGLKLMPPNIPLCLVINNTPITLQECTVTATRTANATRTPTPTTTPTQSPTPEPETMMSAPA